MKTKNQKVMKKHPYKQLIYNIAVYRDYFIF